MKNATKKFLITIAVISMLSLAACGSSEGSSSEAAVTVSSTTSTTTTAESSSDEADASSEAGASEEVSSDETSSAPEAEADDSESAGISEIEILEAAADNAELSSGSAEVTIGNKQISLSGAYIIDGVDVELTGGSYSSAESDQNVFLVINGGSLKISNAEIVKSGDAGTNDSTRTSDVSDDYNFYGNELFVPTSAD